METHGNRHFQAEVSEGADRLNRDLVAFSRDQPAVQVEVVVVGREVEGRLVADYKHVNNVARRTWNSFNALFFRSMLMCE